MFITDYLDCLFLISERKPRSFNYLYTITFGEARINKYIFQLDFCFPSHSKSSHAEPFVFTKSLLCFFATHSEKKRELEVCSRTEVRQSGCHHIHRHSLLTKPLTLCYPQLLITFCTKTIPCIIPGLKDREQSNVIWKPVPSKIPVDVIQAFAFTDERLRETGGCRYRTNSISHTERNHRKYQDWDYCCQQLLQAVDSRKNSLLETLVIWCLSTRALHRNTSLEADVTLDPIPALSQQPVFAGPFSIFPPFPHHPHHIILVRRTLQPLQLHITVLLLLKQNVWIHFSSCLGMRFHVSPPPAHCYS